MAATRSATAAPANSAATTSRLAKTTPNRMPRGGVRADGHNEVVLCGRVSGEPTVRVLPSGDELVSWRLVVGRDKPGLSPRGRQLQTVDTIDCIAFKTALRRVAGRWTGGEVIEVRGALRRRFWRGPHGAASRCEVEVLAIKKLAASR